MNCNSCGQACFYVHLVHQFKLGFYVRSEFACDTCVDMVGGLIRAAGGAPRSEFTIVIGQGFLTVAGHYVANLARERAH